MEKDQMVQSLHRSFTQLTKFISQLMREQFSCGPVTILQCQTLEALVEGPKTMNLLATEMALHQSTMTRVVEKLENQKMVCRNRKVDNQRIVQVNITDAGKQTYQYMNKECLKLMAAMLELIPQDQQTSVVNGMQIISHLLDPENDAFQQLLKGCCTGQYNMGQIYQNAASSPCCCQPVNDSKMDKGDKL
ncbi:MAG: MarR family winged helix-turn-helix transcriptional regulator [Planctomycetota bacterium]|jgi:DNA-binding MarR family transcriptional regulator